MVKCCGCSKGIKATGRLRLCRECKKPVCFGCQINGICKECGIILYQNTVEEDYFKDKYETKEKIHSFG